MVLSIFLSVNTFPQGPYPPAAGQPGSTAIYKDSTSIKSWATGIEIYRGWVNIADTSVYYNGSNKATFGYPSIALGAAQQSSYDVVSFGDGGMATLTFDRAIVNGTGPDFVVFENGFSDTFLELAFVEVSSDGSRFVRFPSVSLTQTETQVGGFDLLDPTNIHNLAGKYRQGYGTPFDLNDLTDSTGIDLNNIRFVRLIDVVGNINDEFCTYDSQGNKVNDPWETPFHSCGFDLDAIGVINQGNEFIISDFNDLTLTENSYWNGSDHSGGFTSNSVTYANNYNPDYFSWSGFAYSNMEDDSTAGFTNQYSAITAGGMDATDEGGTNYGVGFVPIDWEGGTYNMLPIVASLEEPSIVSGLYVTNSTYAYLSMRDGDSFAKKFGGTTGDDPDYFKLIIWGERQDNSLTDEIEFYLADYRFEDNTNDYLIDNWRWVDLKNLGVVSKLWFSLESTDMSAYGMNTPAYFNIDNLTIIGEEAVSIARIKSSLNYKIYPNPFTDRIVVECKENSVVNIYDLFGRKVFETISNSNFVNISTENLKQGCYIVTVLENEEIFSRKIIKQ